MFSQAHRAPPSGDSIRIAVCGTLSSIRRVNAVKWRLLAAESRRFGSHTSDPRAGLPTGVLTAGTSETTDRSAKVRIPGGPAAHDSRDHLHSAPLQQLEAHWMTEYLVEHGLQPCRIRTCQGASPTCRECSRNLNDWAVVPGSEGGDEQPCSTPSCSTLQSTSKLVIKMDSSTFAGQENGQPVSTRGNGLGKLV